MRNNKLLKYKEYLGSVDVDLASGVLYGKIQFINDIVTYEAETLPELKTEFEAAVDDYLETCEVIGKEPQRTYSGSFNVRIGEELHREAAFCSLKKDVNLNEFCREAISEKVEAVKATEQERGAVVQIKLIDPTKIPKKQSGGEFMAEYLSFSPENDVETSTPKL